MEEAKKMKCYKRLTYKQFVQLSFRSLWSIVSKVFAELCMERPYWCTVLVPQCGRRKSTKHLEITFSINQALSFHSRTSIGTRKHNLLRPEMVIVLKIKRRDFFTTRQHSYFGVTHSENSEVQIAVFSK